MKLSDHLTLRLSGIFILIIFIWSVVYLFIQMKEIHDGIDEGLNNLKQEFIYKANNSPDFINAMIEYNPLNIIVEPISYEKALDFKETYTDSKVYFVTEEEDEEVRMLTTAFYCELDKQYYKLNFFTSTVERDDLVKNMLFLLIALWICLALAIIVVVKKIINRSNRPFYRLLESLRRFELGNTRMIEFPDTNITEYKELNKSVQNLLEDNIRAFTEQKNFIENASHELQTPLAITIGQLESMLNDKTLGQPQIEEISSVLASLSRMKRLNSTLLFLSKINNKQFVNNEPVNINQLTLEITDNFEDIIEHKEIAFFLNEQEPLIVQMNKDLAYILITNLLKNAIFHNIKEGRINITINKDSYIISNDGKPLGDNIDIFERYKSVAGDMVSSSGLGLSIVKSITNIYKFKITYEYKDMHIFTIRFH